MLMRLQMLLQMLLPHANANATAPICSALTRQNLIAGESVGSDSQNLIAYESGLTLGLESHLRDSDRLQIGRLRFSESDRLQIWSDTRLGISSHKI